MTNRKQIEGPDFDDEPSEPGDEANSGPWFDDVFGEEVKRIDLEADISRYKNWAPASPAGDMRKQTMLSKRRQELGQVLGRVAELKRWVPVKSYFSRAASIEIKQPIATFPRIEGLLWEQVMMTFISDDAIKVQAGGTKKRFHYAEIAFKDGRKGDASDSRWTLLRLFARFNGEIDWATKIPAADIAKSRFWIKEAMKVIRQRLKAFMQISDDPFFPYRQFWMYKTRFRIGLAHPEAYDRRDELKADSDAQLDSNYNQADMSESDRSESEDGDEENGDDSES